jgi:hypothetical protein
MKGLGVLKEEPEGSDDPATIAKELELAKRGEKAKLATKEQQIFLEEMLG